MQHMEYMNQQIVVSVSKDGRQVHIRATDLICISMTLEDVRRHKGRYYKKTDQCHIPHDVFWDLVEKNGVLRECLGNNKNEWRLHVSSPSSTFLNIIKDLDKTERSEKNGHVVETEKIQKIETFDDSTVSEEKNMNTVEHHEKVHEDTHDSDVQTDRHEDISCPKDDIPYMLNHTTRDHVSETLTTTQSVGTQTEMTIMRTPKRPRYVYDRPQCLQDVVRSIVCKVK